MTHLLTHKPEAISRALASAHHPADVLVTFAELPGVFALESVCNTSGYGNFTIIGGAPIDTITLDVTSPAAGGPDPLAQLARAVGCQPLPAPAAVPFSGGWVGCIPYEAGAVAENVRPACGAAPLGVGMRFALYDSAVVLDSQTRTWHIGAVDLPQSTRPARVRIEELAALVESSPGQAARRFGGRSPRPGPLPTPNLTRSAYLRAVERALGYIEAGDIYQVNLSQRFTTRTESDPLELYLRLRRANPADFAAYLRWGDQAVLSSSPELFLELQPDGSVVTRPIKGTRPRSGDATTDTASRRALLASEKDRAELNMIIDLLRNDLGKVCEFGSVRVLCAREVEAHPTVLHLVATIAGRLRQDSSGVDLLRAAFPGGSITGCPKIRAMQIINELERTPRGAYCGSIGYLGMDGRLSMNIAIRTMQYDAGRLHIHAGGAITADSDPEAEYRETLAKAEGMFRALDHSTAELAEGEEARWRP